MSCIVKQKRKGADGTEVIYAYESTSIWIPGKGPRSKRHLLGRVDPITGDIVPTGKRGRKKKESQPGTVDLPSATPNNSDLDRVKQDLIDAVSRGQLLEKQLAELTEENNRLCSTVQALQAKLSETERCLQKTKSILLHNLEICINNCKVSLDQ